VEITGNVVSGSLTGVYVRDSSAVVERNTVNRMTNHAVTVVGAATGTVVSDNTISGRGPSAVDIKRADAVMVGENDTSGWVSTKPFWTIVRNALQPLTIMWLSLGLVLVATALKGTRHRMRGLTHPYEAQRRLAEIVEPPRVPGVRPQLDDDAPVRSGRRTMPEVGGPAWPQP
jgi:hypothetical protein